MPQTGARGFCTGPLAAAESILSNGQTVAAATMADQPLLALRRVGGKHASCLFELWGTPLRAAARVVLVQDLQRFSPKLFEDGQGITKLHLKPLDFVCL